MNYNNNKLCDRIINCLHSNKSYKKITHFIHKKVFINYEVLWEILLNNNINLILIAIKYYVIQLNAWYYIIIFYHSRTNEKMKNFDEILNQILTKYLMNKSM